MAEIPEIPITLTLWRPTGPDELELVRATGMRRWPPRLPSQPIFYPVLSREYAQKIARDWNSRDGGVGYVIQFETDVEVSFRYPTRMAGGRMHQELWVPAEELEWLNDRIIGEMAIVDEFRDGKRVGDEGID